MDEKYYKVLGGECRSPCKQFDYSPYLPKGESAGEWLPLIENAKIASDGYYISKYWNMWYSKGARIYEGRIRPSGGVERFSPSKTKFAAAQSAC